MPLLTSVNTPRTLVKKKDELVGPPITGSGVTGPTGTSSALATVYVPSPQVKSNGVLSEAKNAAQTEVNRLAPVVSGAVSVIAPKEQEVVDLGTEFVQKGLDLLHNTTLYQRLTGNSPNYATSGFNAPERTSRLAPSLPKVDIPPVVTEIAKGAASRFGIPTSLSEIVSAVNPLNLVPTSVKDWMSAQFNLNPYPVSKFIGDVLPPPIAEVVTPYTQKLDKTRAGQIASDVVVDVGDVAAGAAGIGGAGSLLKALPLKEIPAAVASFGAWWTAHNMRHAVMDIYHSTTALQQGINTLGQNFSDFQRGMDNYLRSQYQTTPSEPIVAPQERQPPAEATTTSTTAGPSGVSTAPEDLPSNTSLPPENTSSSVTTSTTTTNNNPSWTDFAKGLLAGLGGVAARNLFPSDTAPATVVIEDDSGNFGGGAPMVGVTHRKRKHSIKRKRQNRAITRVGRKYPNNHRREVTIMRPGAATQETAAPMEKGHVK